VEVGDKIKTTPPKQHTKRGPGRFKNKNSNGKYEKKYHAPNSTEDRNVRNSQK